MKEKYLKPAVIRQIARLDLKAKFIVEGFISGLHKSPYKGFSVEFSEHRRYFPGDEISHIDWGVWARTDKYYIKQFKAETNQMAYLVLDSSLSMAYQYRQELSKLDYAISVAASLGYLMIHQQDSVGMVLFDEQIFQMVPPSSKRSHLIRLLRELARIQPSKPSSISHSLHQLADGIRKRGMILVFSDFIPSPSPQTKEDPIEKELQDLKLAFQHFRSKGHDVMVFQILDESEACFSFSEPFIFKDPERGIKVEGHPSMKEDYLQTLKDYQDRLRKLCLEEKMDFIALHTGENFDKPLMSFLLHRKNRF
ncbi:MAG: DUF58 domain-containing protein [Planctomycetota bacterium]|nr:MAG: DUF58 domain-containing protein [Planctomycetota bacterium]